MAAKKCLYFTAAALATTLELADVVRLEHRGYVVGVRNGALAAASYKFGTRLEAADAIACIQGGTIPSVFTDAIADYPDGDVTMGVLAKPEAIKLISPASLTFAHTLTKQLVCVKADLAEDETEGVTLTDVTLGSAGTTYVSGTPGTCTVSADGLLTGVAGGTSLITATHTYASGKTVTASVTVTCS